MTITAKNIGRINVWPTDDIARAADTEESKYIGRMTVWWTNDEARANTSHDEEGGGGGLDWVPANAKIHIDLVGGDPQGRAWVEGTGVVAVDTQLGADSNADTGWGDGTTAYSAGYLTVDGYAAPDAASVAMIGVLRSSFLAGATLAFKSKNVDVGEFGDHGVSIATVAADGNDAVQYNNDSVDGTAEIQSWGGSLSGTIPEIDNSGDGAVNTVAITNTSTRFEVAQNGSAPFAGVTDETDRPPGNPLVAIIVISSPAIQSITLSDPLPSTAGLSALSEVT